MIPGLGDPEKEQDQGQMDQQHERIHVIPGLENRWPIFSLANFSFRFAHDQGVPMEIKFVKIR